MARSGKIVRTPSGPGGRASAPENAAALSAACTTIARARSRGDVLACSVVRGIAEIASRITRAIAVPGFSLGESIRASSAARRDLAAKTGEGASGFAARVGDFTGDRGRERLREIEREGVVPVARAVEARADDALGIDEPRFGEELGAVLAVDDLVAVRIDEDREVVGRPDDRRERCARVFGAFVGRDRDELDLTRVGFEHLREVGDVRQLLEAGAARLGPEVQNHRLAPEAREPDGAASQVGELEIGRRAVAAGVVGAERAEGGAGAAGFAVARGR